MKETISLLARAVRELNGVEKDASTWFKSQAGPISKHDLKVMERNIMALSPQIAAYVEKTNAHNARIDAAIAGVKGDVEAQAALIKQLQENPGPISPEDQAALDQLQISNEALAAKLEAVDAQTAPPPPPPV